MNATQIASVHIHHLRSLLQSNPADSAALHEMIGNLMADIPYIHPNITMRNQRRPVVRPSVIEIDADFMEMEQIIEHMRIERSFRQEIRRKCSRKFSSKYTEARLNASSEMDCAICYEVPTLKQLCMTSCGHSFCTPCFERWEEQCVQRTNATCPACRTEKPKLTVYAPRRQQIRTIPVV